jgi:hypothetical protein
MRYSQRLRRRRQGEVHTPAPAIEPLLPEKQEEIPSPQKQDDPYYQRMQRIGRAEGMENMKIPETPAVDRLPNDVDELGW